MLDFLEAVADNYIMKPRCKICKRTFIYYRIRRWEMKIFILVIISTFFFGIIIGYASGRIENVQMEMRLYREAKVRICADLDREIGNVQKYHGSLGYIEDALEGKL